MVSSGKLSTPTTNRQHQHLGFPRHRPQRQGIANKGRSRWGTWNTTFSGLVPKQVDICGACGVLFFFSVFLPPKCWEKKHIYIYMYICIYAPAKSNWKPNLRSSQKKRLNMVFFEGNIEQKRRTVGWKIDHIMMDFQLAGVKLIMFRSWTSIQYPYLPHSIGFSSKKNSPTRWTRIVGIGFLGRDFTF